MTRGGMPLICTWTLKEWRNVTPDGRSVWPLGREETGYISYSADGHVFVHLMAAGRTHYVGTDVGFQ